MKYIFIALFAASSAFAQEWQALTNISENFDGSRFDDVFFLNEDMGWAANGASAAIYKTTDGGENWTLQLAENTPELPGNRYFRNVEFLNENIGFVGTLNAQFLKTTNGGTTWAQVTNFTTNPLAICGIDCVGDHTVYGCGAYFSPAYVIKSTDSGETWDYIDMSAYATALVEIMFMDENEGYASGSDENGGVILHTTDGGATWTSLYNTNIPGEYVWKLQKLMSDPNVIFGSVESVSPLNGKLVRSLDNGATWTSREVPDTDIQAVGFLTQDHGWMGGHHTGFLETFDGGQSWNSATVGSNLNRIFFLSDNLAYASGSTIYKYSVPLRKTQFTEKDRTPLKANISPNPVKDKLIVTIDFTDPDHLRIELYDLLGHRIKVLQIEEIAAAGRKTYSFDFPYPKGMYLINLHTNTGRQSLKFVK